MTLNKTLSMQQRTDLKSWLQKNSARVILSMYRITMPHELVFSTDFATVGQRHNLQKASKSNPAIVYPST